MPSGRKKTDPDSRLGKKFNKIKLTSWQFNDGKLFYNFKCDCGNQGNARWRYIVRGSRKTCDSCMVSPRLTHGDTVNRTLTKEFIAWCQMRSRCTQVDHISYKRYGARGIKVCDRWMNSFENFLSDVGRAPSEKHSLDRIDNDKNYEPSNCKWSTKQEQCNNRRSSKYLTIKGERKTIANWARERNIPYRKFYYSSEIKKLRLQQR